LLARPAIGVVVLNGCRTGARETVDTVGLPHGFLLAGARAVLATERDIEDASAARFVARFYDAGGDHQPGRAFQEAIRTSIKESDDSWRAFRLWGPLESP